MSSKSPVLDSETATGGDSEEWHRMFMETVQETQRQMCLEPHRRNREDCKELLASVPSGPHTELSTNVEPPDNTTSNTMLAANSTEWSSMFMKMVQDAEREMCAEPHRRDRADCRALLAAMPREESREAANQPLGGALRERSASLEAHMKKVSHDHNEWEHAFEDQVRQLHRELCQEPSRRHRKDCEEFLASVPSSEAPKPQGEEVEEATERRKRLRASVAREADQWEAAFELPSEQRSSLRGRQQKAGLDPSETKRSSEDDR